MLETILAERKQRKTEKKTKRAQQRFSKGILLLA